MSREDWPENSTDYCETITHSPSFPYDANLSDRCDEIIKALEVANIAKPLFNQIQRLTQYALRAKERIGELVRDADKKHFEHSLTISKDGKIELREPFSVGGSYVSTSRNDKELAEALVSEVSAKLKASRQARPKRKSKSLA